MTIQTDIYHLAIHTDMYRKRLGQYIKYRIINASLVKHKECEATCGDRSDHAATTGCRRSTNPWPHSILFAARSGSNPEHKCAGL